MFSFSVLTRQRRTGKRARKTGPFRFCLGRSDRQGLGPFIENVLLRESRFRNFIVELSLPLFPQQFDVKQRIVLPAIAQLETSKVQPDLQGRDVLQITKYSLKRKDPNS